MIAISMSALCKGGLSEKRGCLVQFMGMGMFQLCYDQLKEGMSGISIAYSGLGCVMVNSKKDDHELVHAHYPSHTPFRGFKP